MVRAWHGGSGTWRLCSSAGPRTFIFGLFGHACACVLAAASSARARLWCPQRKRGVLWAILHFLDFNRFGSCFSVNREYTVSCKAVTCKARLAVLKIYYDKVALCSSEKRDPRVAVGRTAPSAFSKSPFPTCFSRPPRRLLPPPPPARAGHGVMGMVQLPSNWQPAVQVQPLARRFWRVGRLSALCGVLLSIYLSSVFSRLRS